jgi:hypothetical protein
LLRWNDICRDGISDRDGMISRRHGILFSIDGMISGRGGMISDRD